MYIIITKINERYFVFNLKSWILIADDIYCNYTEFKNYEQAELTLMYQRESLHKRNSKILKTSDVENKIGLIDLKLVKKYL